MDKITKAGDAVEHCPKCGRAVYRLTHNLKEISTGLAAFAIFLSVAAVCTLILVVSLQQIYTAWTK